MSINLHKHEKSATLADFYDENH